MSAVAPVTPPSEVSFASIPAELRRLPQWVVWKYKQRPGSVKPTKVPYCASNPSVCAKTDDPSTWGSFDQALQVADSGRADGIGFVFTANDPYAGIDLDESITLDDAQAIIDTLASYTELSVSGKGVHLVVKAKVRRGRRRDEVEVYDRGRFFVFTGRPITGTPRTIEPRQAELEAVIAEWFPELANTKTRSTVSRATESDSSDREDLSAWGHDPRAWGFVLGLIGQSIGVRFSANGIWRESSMESVIVEEDSLGRLTCFDNGYGATLKMLRLPELYAAIKTGQVWRMEDYELALWTKLLLVDAKLWKQPLPEVEPPVPLDNLTRAERDLWDGFVLRWQLRAGEDKVMFTKEFIERWTFGRCPKASAPRLLKSLRRKGFIKKVHESPSGKANPAFLYAPGDGTPEPELEMKDA
jgi:hypothetical protein